MRAFAAVAMAAALAGGALWWGMRPAKDAADAEVSISPSALWAATFADTAGARHSLGELKGDVLVVNFWATWCAPCREEMPAFARLQDRWKSRGVRFVGITDDEAEKVDRFGRELSINYPLWVGDTNVGELARRLGNRAGVLPYTVMIDPSGAVVGTKVGPYTEAELESKIAALR